MAVNTSPPGLKPLSTAWTQHLQDPQARQDFEKTVRNSNLILERLQGIIRTRIKEINSQSFSVKDFTDPNWSHKQAFHNGEMSQLEKMLDIITLV